MLEKVKVHNNKHLMILGIIWLLAAISDRLWFALDKSVPSWDVADYLTASLTYWQALQNPQWFSEDWWTNLWMLSPKIPPLTFILTVPFQDIFSPSPDSATLVHLVFSAILLASVYSLGSILFNKQVGFWAAVLCVLFPGLYRYRLQFLLDYPLTAMVTFSFYCLTVWKFTNISRTGVSPVKDQKGRTGVSPVKHSRQWFWAIAFGLSFGLAIAIKQTALFFLFIPIVWVGIAAIKQRHWQRFAQLISGLLLGVAVFFPWVKTNWLLMFTAGKRATVDSAIAEGDPSLLTLDAWLYYWKLLPYHISWPLLLIPLVSCLLYLITKEFKILSVNDFKNQPETYSLLTKPTKSLKRLLRTNFEGLKWLTIYLIGGYLICSLNINKDFRYTLPLLPVISILLAYGLTLLPRHWGKEVRLITVSLAVILMLLNLWPMGGYFGQKFVGWLSPGGDRHAYLGKEWPHQELIAEIIKSEPYLQTTLGVLPSTPEINQHNLNYYGALQDRQVYGRQVGTNLEQVPQDARSLSWFVTKTNNQGSVNRIKKAQAAIVKTIETSGEFDLQKSWQLPDNSNLNLYRRRLPLLEVYPLGEPRKKVKLDYAIVPENAPPGKPVPITYKWSGPWEELQSGLLLLTYRKTTGETQFIHDRAIGMGALHPGPLEASKSEVSFEVIERLGMLPPSNIPPGNYLLEAIYLNRKTGESYQLEISPPVQLKIEEEAIALSTPELDLVSQLRSLSAQLPKGIEGLETVFSEVARINQYDPVQDYTVVAEKTLKYRLQREPNNLELAYNLALAEVLQQDAKEAIAALKKVTELDPLNSFAHAYLGFVYLYDWNPKAAEVALKKALELNPDSEEIRALNGVAELMQGNIIGAWRDFEFVFRE
ncbi:MAG: phospholipid carrier-dependent glycosyltransferase [Cyanobacteriota bacterium]|nr:phospholipid carrier-dependent glycosyltransferase [Cyanobacteriota bacterium]